MKIGSLFEDNERPATKRAKKIPPKEKKEAYAGMYKDIWEVGSEIREHDVPNLREITVTYIRHNIDNHPEFRVNLHCFEKNRGFYIHASYVVEKVNPLEYVWKPPLTPIEGLP